MGSDPICHRVTTGLFYNRVQRYRYHQKVSIFFTLNFIVSLLKMLNTVTLSIPYAFKQTNRILMLVNVMQLLLLLCGDVEKKPGPNTPEHSISILHLNIRSIVKKLTLLQTTFWTLIYSVSQKLILIKLWNVLFLNTFTTICILTICYIVINQVSYQDIQQLSN